MIMLIFGLWFIGTLFLIVMEYRNHLVYRTRIRVLDNEDYLYDDYHKFPTYDSMIRDFSCWTQKQFFQKHNIRTRIRWDNCELLD